MAFALALLVTQHGDVLAPVLEAHLQGMGCQHWETPPDPLSVTSLLTFPGPQVVPGSTMATSVTSLSPSRSIPWQDPSRLFPWELLLWHCSIPQLMSLQGQRGQGRGHGKGDMENDGDLTHCWVQVT